MASHTLLVVDPSQPLSLKLALAMYLSLRLPLCPGLRALAQPGIYTEDIGRLFRPCPKPGRRADRVFLGAEDRY